MYVCWCLCLFTTVYTCLRACVRMRVCEDVGMCVCMCLRESKRVFASLFVYYGVYVLESLRAYACV